MQQNPYYNYLVNQQQPISSASNFVTPYGFNPNMTQPITQNQAPSAQVPPMGPNAVNINIVAPQAYGTTPSTSQIGPNNFYPIYGQNQYPQMPLYPMNYNNLMTNPMDENQKTNALSETNLVSKTDTTSETNKENKAEEKNKTKQVVPLTNEYVQSLEGYLDDSNPKVRLIGAKELMQRFKEDDNRKDNPSLLPLLNKTLRDNNAAVRFLALTSLQLGYCVGNDETVQILKEIQAGSQNQLSEDSILASEVLLKMAQGDTQEIIDNSPSDTPKEEGGN